LKTSIYSFQYFSKCAFTIYSKYD